MRSFLLFLFLLCNYAARCQDITLHGKLTTGDNAPVEAATVYLSRVKDSLVTQYTVSDEKGYWELKTPAVTDSIYLKVSYLGTAGYVKKFPYLDKDIDLGTLQLADAPIEMDSLVLEQEAPPIRFKKDTIEFNASSFKVKPDAKVRELLGKLPGFALDADGNLTFNGKPVDKVLVDGNPFFDTNGDIALDNLPADIIDKIQVSDTKSDQQEMAGLPSDSNSSSINITFKKGMNKGFFGNIAAGYGTNDRYNANAFLNYFNDKRRASIIGSIGNTDAPGLSSFPGLYSRVAHVRSGGQYISGGGGTGIGKTYSTGFNYNDELVKDLQTSLGYTYSGNDNKNRNRTETTNFLPEGDDPDNPGSTIDKSYTTHSVSSSESSRFSHNANSSISFRRDTLINISYRPRFSYSHSFSDNANEQSSTRLADDALLNESTSQSFSESTTNNFSGSLTIFKQLNSKKGRGISFAGSHINNASDSENRNLSDTKRYSYPDGETVLSEDNRNQKLYNKNRDNNYISRVDYFEPLTDSLVLKLSAEYAYKNTVSDRRSYDFDPVSENFTVFNDSLSNYLSSQNNSITPLAGLVMNRKKITVSMDAGAEFSSLKSHSFYLGDSYRLKKKYILPSANLTVRFTFKRMDFLSFAYSYSSDFPTVQQLLPVEDVSDPLHTFSGNPNLDPSQSHSMNFTYNKFDFTKNKGLSLYSSALFYKSQIVAFTTTDESATQTTSYTNISGSYTTSLGANWYKTYKKEERSLSLRGSLSANYGNIKSYLNGELNSAASLGLSLSFSVDYDYGELFSVSPSYSFNYSRYNYSNYSAGSAESYVHRVALTATSYWPKNLIFTNDVTYTYNSNIGSGFKKGSYLWNSSVGYNFFKETLLFRASVYDVLNQNNGNTRTVGATTVTNQESLVLKRYVMFSLTYKINRFGNWNKDKTKKP